MDVTVFIIDDEAPVRSAITRVLTQAGIDSRSFASGAEFLAAYQPDMKGCLLLDVSMPGMGGIELQAVLAERGVTLPIVFLTGRGDVATAVTAMKRGALDFLEKPFDPEILVARVRQAVDHDARARHEQQQRAEVVERYQSLTPREREVMQLVVKGLASKEVARALGASKKTIDIHRSRLMRKMEAGSVAELVRLARLLGSTPPA